MNLLTFVKKGMSQFPEQSYVQGVENKNTACALTTMHAGYCQENGGCMRIMSGCIKYVRQVHNLSHPLNHKLCQTSVSPKNIPIDKEQSCIQQVMERFGYLPLRWAVVALNDQCHWERERIGNWANKQLSND